MDDIPDNLINTIIGWTIATDEDKKMNKIEWKEKRKEIITVRDDDSDQRPKNKYRKVINITRDNLDLKGFYWMRTHSFGVSIALGIIVAFKRRCARPTTHM